MNVYDFDNTIYDGESAVDFFLFIIKRDRSFLSLLPLLFRKLIKYKLCLITSEELSYYAEKYALRFFNKVENLDALVAEFWDGNINKIKPYYSLQKKDDDVILSASPDFILDEAMRRLGITNYICSTIDRATGKVGHLCFRSNKVELFRERFGNARVENFYSDSMNDKPMMDIADKAYLVRANRIKQVK